MPYTVPRKHGNFSGPRKMEVHEKNMPIKFASREQLVADGMSLRETF